MMRLTFVVAAAMVCTASSAHAHAFLERALPPVGSETATPPHQIATTADERNLSLALLTSEFHSA